MPTNSSHIDLRQKQAGGAATATKSEDRASKFDIPESVKNTYPDLIPLIIATESMNDEERQYWFHILPIMTDEQVSKLREILLNEKRELERLDNEYEDEIKKINDSHLAEWKAMQAKQKREQLKSEEAEHEKEEHETEQTLLKKLQNL